MSVPKLRFPEFLDAGEWEEKKLEDIATIKAGTTPSRANSEFYANGSIPWVKTTDLNNSYIYTTQEKVTPLAKVKLNPIGSVLVAMYGGFNQIGRTGYLKIPAATNQAISVLNVKKDILTSAYLLIWLNAKIDYWKKLAISSRKDANITGSDVADFPIAFPSLIEQQKIADCLSFLSDRITAETQKLNTLKAHKKGLMQQLLPAEGETLPKLRFPEFINAGEWEKGTIENLAITTMGNAFKSSDFVENGLQLVRMGNLYQGELQLNRTPVYLPTIFTEEHSNFLVKPLDLLMSMTGTVGKKDYGFIVQVPKNCKPLLLNQRVMKIEPKKNCIKEFLLQMLKNDSLLNKLYSSAGGTKQANLSAQQLKDLNITFPQQSEQQKIADCLTSIDEAITAQTQKIAALKLHKKGLMQQLFPSVEDVRG